MILLLLFYGYQSQQIISQLLQNQKRTEQTSVCTTKMGIHLMELSA